MISAKNSQSTLRNTGGDPIYDFDIYDIIDYFDLDAYKDQNQKRKTEVLKLISGVELYRTLQVVNRELAAMRTEIVVLNNSLVRIDPNFQRTDGPALQYQFKRNFLPGNRKSKTTSLRGSKTSASQVSSARVEYHLNFLAKTEMTTQSKMFLEKEILQIKKAARNETIDIRAKIKESFCLIDDMEHMEKDFRLFFFDSPENTEMLRRSTEANLELKLHSFEKSWMKLAQQLVYKIRLETHSTSVACHEIHNDITAKVLFRNILCQADYDLMQIKCDNMENELATTQLRANSNEEILSKVAGKLTADKKHIQMLEQKFKDLTMKTAELNNANENIRKDTIRQEINYERDVTKKEDLLKQMLAYSAPSVNDYASLKDMYQRLLKEEKTLRRKLYIIGLGKK